MKLFYALLAIASALGTFAAELEVPDRSIEITDLVVAFDKAFLKLRRISFQANVPEQKSYFECEAQSPSADDVLNEIPDRYKCTSLNGAQSGLFKFGIESPYPTLVAPANEVESLTRGYVPMFEDRFIVYTEWFSDGFHTFGGAIIPEGSLFLQQVAGDEIILTTAQDEVIRPNVKTNPVRHL